MNSNSIYGKYQHYKNKKIYEVIGIALHSETKEEMVVYKALYQSESFDKYQWWVRPKTMFFEQVVHDGNQIQRFSRIDE